METQRFSIASMVSGRTMLLLSAEIDLDHPLIILHLVERSIAENVSLVQNRDLAPELTNENHVVLDDNDRMLPSQTEKKIPSLSRFLVGHAGCRLINQEKLSVLREQHADLEPLSARERDSRPWFQHGP